MVWPVYLLGARGWGSSNKWRRMSRDVSYYQQHECLLKRLFQLTAHEISKLSIIGPMLGNHPSTVDSLHKGPATWEAFWCHRVMMQTYCWHNSGALCAWARAQTDIRRVYGGSGYTVLVGRNLNVYPFRPDLMTNHLKTKFRLQV